MRPSLILAAATLLAIPSLAHADTFSYILDGGTSGFSGTGTLTAVATGSGAYLVQSAATANGDVLFRHQAHPTQVLNPRVANDVTLAMKPIAGTSSAYVPSDRQPKTHCA